MGTIQIDGSTPKLTIGNATAEDATILFDGNAQDFYIALDDSADDLLIGLGSTVGTTPIISIDENKLSTFSGAITVGVDDTGHDVKLFGATASRYWLWDESADGVVQRGTLTVGVDDTGHDVKLFGASAGAYMEWDESADELRIMGASADATTSTGKLLLATSLTDINANDVIGKIDFQAPHEAGGTDAITVAASIRAIAQATFTSSVNATDLIFYTGHSEAAAEKIRFTSQNEIGIAGANYGTDGQVLTSAGAGAAVAWEDAGGFDVSSITGATALAAEPALTDEIVLSDAGTLKRLDLTHIYQSPLIILTRTANLTVSNATATKVPWDDTPVKQVSGTYDTTNERYTPGIASWYKISVFGRWNDFLPDGKLGPMQLYKNGSHLSTYGDYAHYMHAEGSTLNSTDVYYTIPVYLDADDYVELFVYQNSGGSGIWGGGYNHFMVTRIIGAGG